MYLAPLNYDRYFKKVFSDLDIAKRFLEDFFDVTITKIDLLTIQHKITDDAVAVEFDFRCEIDNQLVIIDMQQWYKPDIVHRFYTYHCINTALQLESLTLKSIAIQDGKIKSVKDYSQILPVITLVWMVDDTFGFKDDYVSYTMTPELVLDFIKNHLLWKNDDFAELLKQRELALAQLSNRTKKLDFLQKNRLIYAFQKNIVANSKKAHSKMHKYLNWFELAEKTKNKLNQKSDFLQYTDDKIFANMIRRLSKDSLTEDDFTYIENYEAFTEQVKRWEKPIFEEGVEKGIGIGVEKGIGIGVEKGIGIGVEKGIGIGVEKGIGIGIYEVAKNAITEGFPNEIIRKITKLTDEEIDAIRIEIKQ